MSAQCVGGPGSRGWNRVCARTLWPPWQGGERGGLTSGQARREAGGGEERKLQTQGSLSPISKALLTLEACSRPWTSCMSRPCPARSNTHIQFCPPNIYWEYSMQGAIFLPATGSERDTKKNKIRAERTSKWFSNFFQPLYLLPTPTARPKK